MIVLPNAPLETVYFPGSATFALLEEVGDHRYAEIAVVGHEGMLGWPALLGCDASSHAAICQTSGTLLSAPVKALRLACSCSTSLWSALLQFVNLIIIQMGRAIASHLQDPLDQRLARWLLMHHDRVGGDVLLVQHEQIADRLNVRRASITDRLHVLEGERMIRCNRGRILIRDRPALESFAGVSYGVVEAHYRNLIAPFGKSLQKAC